tara:strand:+ start:354 stop:617 length:264 start_codon:yes stop_codon:yes gene_type:complete
MGTHNKKKTFKPADAIGYDDNNVSKVNTTSFANTIIPGTKKGVTKEQNFDAAFKKARKKLGPNKEFMYKLKDDSNFKKYTTNYKKEK